MDNFLRFCQSPSEMTLREFKFSLKLVYISITTLLQNELALKVHLRICYGSEHLCNRTVTVDAYVQKAFTCLKPDIETLEQGVTSI